MEGDLQGYAVAVYSDGLDEKGWGRHIVICCETDFLDNLFRNRSRHLLANHAQ